MTRLQDFMNDLTVKHELNDEEIQEVIRYELNDLGVEKPEWIKVEEITGKLKITDIEEIDSIILIDCPDCF